jgi:nicotinamidase-related amidase
MPASTLPIPKRNDTLLVFIDIQERLFKAMSSPIQGQMIQKTKLLLSLAKRIEIPILVTEQYPKGLGETIPELKGALETNYSPVTKLSFSCCGEESFPQKVAEMKKPQMLLTGMETHVCVLQTALDLLRQGYQLFVPRDAVCSRKKADWEAGLNLMHMAGAFITTTETLIFQLLEKAGTEEFKYMSQLIKGS